MQTLTFDVPIPPKPSNRKRAAIVGGHARVVQDPGVRQHQQTLAALAAVHRPPQIIRGPVRLDILAIFPQRASTAKRDRDRYEPHSTRPDRDNLAKTVQDALTHAGFWGDDGQAYAGEVAKVWGRYGEPGRYRLRLTWDMDDGGWLDALPF